MLSANSFSHYLYFTTIGRELLLWLYGNNGWRKRDAWAVNRGPSTEGQTLQIYASTSTTRDFRRECHIIVATPPVRTRDYSDAGSQSEQKKSVYLMMSHWTEH